jgi:hypothetical protein
LARTRFCSSLSPRRQVWHVQHLLETFKQIVLPTLAFAEHIGVLRAAQGIADIHPCPVQVSLDRAVAGSMIRVELAQFALQRTDQRRPPLAEVRQKALDAGILGALRGFRVALLAVHQQIVEVAQAFFI